MESRIVNDYYSQFILLVPLGGAVGKCSMMCELNRK